MSKGAAILVVEDNASNMLLITTVLKRAGYRVIEAETADQAIALARTETPALILMDVALPGMDGLAATRILKADPLTGSIPIYALTAHVMVGDEQKARDAGCDGYLTKPIDTRAVAATVAAVLAGKRPG
jgi:two-component system, cell cycle response regulator DivK